MKHLNELEVKDLEHIYPCLMDGDGDDEDDDIGGNNPPPKEEECPPGHICP